MFIFGIVLVVLYTLYQSYINTPIEEVAKSMNIKMTLIVFIITLLVWVITFILDARGHYVGYAIFWISLGSIVVFIWLYNRVVRFAEVIKSKRRRSVVTLFVSIGFIMSEFFFIYMTVLFYVFVIEF